MGSSRASRHLRWLCAPVWRVEWGGCSRSVYAQNLDRIHLHWRASRRPIDRLLLLAQATWVISLQMNALKGVDKVSRGSPYPHLLEQSGDLLQLLKWIPDGDKCALSAYLLPERQPRGNVIEPVPGENG